MKNRKRKLQSAAVDCLLFQCAFLVVVVPPPPYFHNYSMELECVRGIKGLFSIIL